MMTIMYAGSEGDEELIMYAGSEGDEESLEVSATKIGAGQHERLDQ